MLKDEITSLGRSLKILKHSTDESEKGIVTAIDVYQKHKSTANMLKPWLEKAQLQTSSVPKPVTLKDIEDQLQQAKVFQTECAKQYSQLQGKLYLKIKFTSLQSFTTNKTLLKRTIWLIRSRISHKRCARNHNR